MYPSIQVILLHQVMYSSAKILVVGSQWTQISLQSEWLINDSLFERPTMACTQIPVHSWDPARGFWHWLEGRLNQRFTL